VLLETTSEGLTTVVQEDMRINPPITSQIATLFIVFSPNPKINAN
jgi:hypothetical protein